MGAEQHVILASRFQGGPLPRLLGESPLHRSLVESQHEDDRPQHGPVLRFPAEEIDEAEDEGQGRPSHGRSPRPFLPEQQADEHDETQASDGQDDHARYKQASVGGERALTDEPPGLGVVEHAQRQQPTYAHGQEEGDLDGQYDGSDDEARRQTGALASFGHHFLRRGIAHAS